MNLKNEFYILPTFFEEAVLEEEIHLFEDESLYLTKTILLLQVPEPNEDLTMLCHLFEGLLDLHQVERCLRSVALFYQILI